MYSRGSPDQLADAASNLLPAGRLTGALLPAGGHVLASRVLPGRLTLARYRAQCAVPARPGRVLVNRLAQPPQPGWSPPSCPAASPSAASPGLSGLSRPSDSPWGATVGLTTSPALAPQGPRSATWSRLDLRPATPPGPAAESRPAAPPGPATAPAPAGPATPPSATESRPASCPACPATSARPATPPGPAACPTCPSGPCEAAYRFTSAPSGRRTPKRGCSSGREPKAVGPAPAASRAARRWAARCAAAPPGVRLPGAWASARAASAAYCPAIME